MSRHEFSKYDFAYALAGLRALKHGLDLTYRFTFKNAEHDEVRGELALQIQRIEGLIDLLEHCTSAWIELED